MIIVRSLTSDIGEVFPAASSEVRLILRRSIYQFLDVLKQWVRRVQISLCWHILIRREVEYLSAS